MRARVARFSERGKKAELFVSPRRYRRGQGRHRRRRRRRAARLAHREVELLDRAAQRAELGHRQVGPLPARLREVEVRDPPVAAAAVLRAHAGAAAPDAAPGAPEVGAAGVARPGAAAAAGGAGPGREGRLPVGATGGERCFCFVCLLVGWLVGLFVCLFVRSFVLEKGRERERERESRWRKRCAGKSAFRKERAPSLSALSASPRAASVQKKGFRKTDKKIKRETHTLSPSGGSSRALGRCRPSRWARRRPGARARGGRGLLLLFSSAAAAVPSTSRPRPSFSSSPSFVQGEVSEESARTQTEGERERETTEPERPIGGGNQRRVFKSEKKNNGV